MRNLQLNLFNTTSKLFTAAKSKLSEKKGESQTNVVIGVLITIGLFAILYIIFKDAINGIIKDGLNNAFGEMFNTFK